MAKPETKFWHELKRITPQIRWTRLENTSVFGTPDLLGYNNSGHFFTVELKVTKGVKIRFSPHQIAFHKLHPKNSFILAKSLVSRDVKLYEGSKIDELVACGLALEACCLGLDACGLKLSQLGAWSFTLFFIFFLLVLAINYSGCVPVPACSAAATFSALWRRRAGRELLVARYTWREGPVFNRRCLVDHMIRYYNF